MTKLTWMRLKWHWFCASGNILNCLKLLESLQPLKKTKKLIESHINLWIIHTKIINSSFKVELFKVWGLQNFHAYPSTCICIKPFVCLQLSPFASMSTGEQAIRHVLRKFLSSIRSLTNRKCFSRTELIGLALTTPFLAYRLNKNHRNLWNIWQNHE